MRETDPIIGTFFTTRNMLFSVLAFCGLILLCGTSTPAQAVVVAFFVAVLVFQFYITHGQLQGLKAKRTHLPRVFEVDLVHVTLELSSPRGQAIQMLEVADQFLASLNLRQRNLIPWLTAGWRVRLPYSRTAERHFGLYLIGPIQLRVADPLGIFYERRELGVITRLTVYPRAEPLPDYTIPGSQAQWGASLDLAPRIGPGEEILSIREYRRGDPPSRIHWRTSARRGRLHTLQLNQPIQSELLVLIDMTRSSRFGLGSEATPRVAVAAAVSVLTRAHETRHRLSLGFVQNALTLFPVGSGLAHLHLLLDRLVVLEPGGDADFWQLILPRARLLRPGARAVFIATAAQIDVSVAEALRQLVLGGIAVDCILIDERGFIRIYRDQEAAFEYESLTPQAKAELLRSSGARIFLLDRHHLEFNRQALSAQSEGVNAATGPQPLSMR